MTEEDAQKIANRRLKSRADDFLISLQDAHSEVLPGNHHPAETVLLAYLMTAVDGYNQVELHTRDWDSRPRPGFGTVLGYLVDVGRTLANFMLECRCNGHTRELAIIVDCEMPNVRTPWKQRKETTLASLCSSVMIFSSEEICADPESCAKRIEDQLFHLIEETMADAGMLPRSPSPAS